MQRAIPSLGADTQQVKLVHVWKTQQKVAWGSEGSSLLPGEPGMQRPEGSTQTGSGEEHSQAKQGLWSSDTGGPG